MRVLRQRFVAIASWSQARIDPAQQQLIFRWLFINVVFCSVLLDIVNAILPNYGFETVLFLLATVQIANLTYIHLGPILYVATCLLNGMSFIFVGELSIVYAALRLLRNPMPYLEQLNLLSGH